MIPAQSCCCFFFFYLSKPIAFLTFLLPSRSSLLQLPNRLKKQTQLRTCITLFWYISLPSLNNYDVKCSNFEIYLRKGTARREILLPCLNSDAVPSLQLQPKISLLLSNWANWINREKGERIRSLFYSDVFTGIAVVGS